MASQKGLQLNSLDASEDLPSPTQKKIKTEDSAEPSETKADVAVNDPWEEAAKEYYTRQNTRKDDSTWGTWSEQEILLMKKSYEDAITKYGAEIFDGDDDERIDIAVFDSPDVATATDDDQDAVVEDPQVNEPQDDAQQDENPQDNEAQNEAQDDVPKQANEEEEAADEVKTAGPHARQDVAEKDVAAQDDGQATDVAAQVADISVTDPSLPSSNQI